MFLGLRGAIFFYLWLGSGALEKSYAEQVAKNPEDQREGQLADNLYQ
jgi:hypothetical protein